MSIPSFKSIALFVATTTISWPAWADSGWDRAAAERQLAYDVFVSQNQKGLEYFEDVPVGNSGLPLLVYKVLPDVFPELWSSKEVEDMGFLPKMDQEYAILPQGLAKDIGSTQIIPLPGFEKARMQIVNFSCAGCHTGYVRLEDGSLQKIIGAPNTRGDIARWRRKIYLTVTDPRFTFDNFKKALKSRLPGQLYGLKNVHKEVFDRTVFQFKGKDLLATLAERIKAKEYQVQNYLGRHAYQEDIDLLNGTTPGQVEAFGVGIVKFLPVQPDETTFRSQFGMSFDDFLKTALQSKPAVADIPSIWRQSDRALVQWDGNITNFTLRNLAASVGVIGDPALVNYDNAQKVTEFSKELPPPLYPFTVDSQKARAGKQVFDKACLSCHSSESQTFMPLAQIGTDPTRAQGLSEQGRQLLAKELLASCKDKSNPACVLTDPDRVVLPRFRDPGYVSAPLDGIWARAPYLHNGSVPTLHHLLVPAERPETFYRGNFSYDQEKVGFVWDRPDADFESMYDTRRAGNGRQGHADKNVFFGGIDFGQDHEARESLLEYLKTL